MERPCGCKSDEKRARRGQFSLSTTKARQAATCAALLLCVGAARADLPPPVTAALKQAGIAEDHVAALVYDLDRDEAVLQHGGELAMNPASVMKLLITLAALDRFGPAHTFKTRVLVDGPIQDGVLDGNLILQGGGDPALTQERLWLLLREIRARGVREIRGDIILDGSYYGIATADPGAFDQAPLRPYNAPVAALLVNFNLVTLRLAPGAENIPARLDPPVDFPLANRLAPGDGPCPAVREQLALEPGLLTLTGRYPIACGDQAVALNLLSPDATTAAWLRQVWGELGGAPLVRVAAGSTPATARLLLEFDSPPLAQLARDINKFSNNVMAKMLYLNLGAARFGAPATWDKGERAVREWLAERNLECGKLVLENGAGLSRNERITANALARLLRWVTRQPIWFEFAASLPALGLEGTQKNRLNGSAARGQAWLKSGSLKGVRNLAGYVRTLDGRRRVVVLLINDSNAEAGGRAQDAFVEWAGDMLGMGREDFEKTTH